MSTEKSFYKEMKWIKIKQLFVPDNNFEWMVSHAANPFATKLQDDIYRIYFTSRNKENQSHIGFVDIDFGNNFDIVNISSRPVLSPGEPGLFDDSGAGMGCLLEVDKKIFLYYLGWNLKVTVPWLNAIGLAIYDESKKEFIKYSRAPLMDRSDEDPFTISYPYVFKDEKKYKMWYGSNLGWGNEQSKMNHVFKYAESDDAIHWNRTNEIHIPLIHPNEYALSKPYVIKEDGKYKMWYSYRANGMISTYRIGYAESVDGRKWIRMDEFSGIDVSVSGWDSEMICYPFVFDSHDKRWLLYNGNGYGKTGFGIAVLEK